MARTNSHVWRILTLSWRHSDPFVDVYIYIYRIYSIVYYTRTMYTYVHGHVNNSHVFVVLFGRPASGRDAGGGPGRV